MAITTEKVAASPLVDGSVTALHSHAGGGTGDIAVSNRLPQGTVTLAAEYCAIVVGDYEIATDQVLDIGDNAVMEVT